LDNVVRRYAGYNVPRYTSYPTAADFTPDVGAKEHVAWLGGLDARETVSVYLNVPDFREICL
jgi:oxygen-independent coproporphyrinogen-3 oxidase